MSSSLTPQDALRRNSATPAASNYSHRTDRSRDASPSAESSQSASNSLKSSPRGGDENTSQRSSPSEPLPEFKRSSRRIRVSGGGGGFLLDDGLKVGHDNGTAHHGQTQFGKNMLGLVKDWKSRSRSRSKSRRSDMLGSSHSDKSKEEDIRNKGKKRVGRLDDTHDLDRRSFQRERSPLSMELSREQVDYQERRHSVQSGTSGARSNASSSRGNVTKAHGSLAPQAPPTPSIGFDTDPAQVVDLALSLSESRKRNFSSGRITPAADTVRSRRVVSANQIGSPGSHYGQSTVRQGSGLRQHLIQQRRVSRNVSGLDRSRRLASAASSKLDRPTSSFGSPFPEGYVTHGDDSMVDMIDLEHLPCSNATIARVEKAKKHFELFYEHQRLLPHLPPLKTFTGTDGSSHSPDPAIKARLANESGRVYNPLQYIRNRKVRFREKAPIDTESEGWDNVEAVRSWVDTIVKDHPEHLIDPNQCMRLPPLQPSKLDSQEQNLQTSLSSSGSSPGNGRQPAGKSNVKIPRPRNDWITAPADLIADLNWLEQGLNKTKIEDSHGNRIYPSDIRLKFTGWGNNVGDDSTINETRTKQTSPNPQGNHTPASLSRSHTGDVLVTEKRGRKRHKVNPSITSIQSQNGQSGSRERRHKWHPTFSRSSSSSSDATSEDEKYRGRRKQTEHGINSAALEKHMQELIKREARENQSVDALDLAPPNGQSTPGSVASQVKSGSDPSLSKPSRPPFLILGGSRLLATPRHSLDQERVARDSLDGFDSTAPSSPSTKVQFPSIAISFSPANSRSPSPTKRHLPRIVPMRRHRSKSNQRTKPTGNESVGAFDMPKSRGPSGSHDVSPGSPATERPHKNAVGASGEEDVAGVIRSDTAESKNDKSANAGERIRGIRGKIIGMVGSEVSKVGDFILRRDGGDSSSSSDSDEDTDADKKIRKKRPQQTVPVEPESVTTSSKNKSADAPKYHLSNLPVFTSPFKQNDSEKSNLKTDQVKDEQAREQDYLTAPFPANKGQNGLAPPQDDRRGSYASSVSSDPDAEGAGKRLNDALESLKFSRRGPPITGLASLANTSEKPRKPSNSGSPGLSRTSTKDWKNASSNSVPRVHDSGPVTRRDIVRVRALLLSTGVKAREIHRRATTIPPEQPKWLLRHLSPNEPPPSIAMTEIPAYIARKSAMALDRNTTAVRHSISTFESEAAPQLRKRTIDLERYVLDELSPRVRCTGDDAGQLSATLATSTNLALKKLNDAIDEGIRRRRRRFRWVRKLGYVLLEWALVGIMWWIWTVVIVWKIFRGTVGGVVGGVRWLLWV